MISVICKCILLFSILPVVDGVAVAFIDVVVKVAVVAADVVAVAVVDVVIGSTIDVVWYAIEIIRDTTSNSATIISFSCYVLHVYDDYV